MSQWVPASFSALKSFYDAAARAVVLRFAADGVPSFTWDVVIAMHAIYDDIIAAHACGVDIRFVILSSEIAGIFNMGGDLGLMASMARAGEGSKLKEYGKLSALLVHRTWDALGLPIASVAAVEGDAFGGGFEAALSANFVVASKGSRFAFPEVRFGMFPGMGATSLLGRRISPAYVTNMISDARVISATAAQHDGFIDRLVPSRTEETVLRTLARIGAEGRARLIEVAAMRRRNARYFESEATAIVMIWAEAVLEAPERTLAHMSRIVKAQKARLARGR